MITQEAFDQTLAAVKAGELDAQLDLLRSAISHRQQSVNYIKGHQLVGGDIVVFNERTKPRYLIGLRAKVLSVNQVTAYVEMLPGQDAGKFQRSRQIRVPFSLIDKTN